MPMITVKYNGKTYQCTTAIKGSTYVHLLDKGGRMLAQFMDGVDFNAFEIEGGEWTLPNSAYDAYVKCNGDKCYSQIGNQASWDMGAFKYFQEIMAGKSEPSEPSEPSVSVDLPLSVVDGKLCITYTQE